MQFCCCCYVFSFLIIFPNLLSGSLDITSDVVISGKRCSSGLRFEHNSALCRQLIMKCLQSSGCSAGGYPMMWVVANAAVNLNQKAGCTFPKGIPGYVACSFAELIKHWHLVMQERKQVRKGAAKKTTKLFLRPRLTVVLRRSGSHVVITLDVILPHIF